MITLSSVKSALEVVKVDLSQRCFISFFLMMEFNHIGMCVFILIEIDYRRKKKQ